MDFGKLKGMQRLTELCIHSSEPFHLPAFSFQGSLSRLSELTQLTTLVISNVEGNLLNELVFLKNLSRLKSLTFGFCFDWTTESFEAVGTLLDLRFLSLNGLSFRMEEMGVDSSFVSCLTSHNYLEELELIDFFIPESCFNQYIYNYLNL